MRILITTLTMLLITSAVFSQREDRRSESDRIDRMESIKVAFITKELNLTPEESQVFWPIYNKHNDEYKSLRKDAKANGDFDDLSESEAEQLINNHLATEEAKIKMMRSLVNSLDGVISKRKMAKLVRAEEKFKREMLGKIRQKMKEKEAYKREKEMRKREHR